jgi:hypothetical protein
MTTQEFSASFDTILNSYVSKNKEFGDVSSPISIELDEYEKSVFLTLAQDIVVYSYFDISPDGTSSGFDSSERRQIDFSNLIKVAEIDPTSGSTLTQYVQGSTIVTMPNDILRVLNEKVRDNTNNTYIVVPINYREYDRVCSKPYAKPFKRQAWRLFQSNKNGNAIDKYSELLLPNANTISKYIIRYVRKPGPIILTDLTATNYNFGSELSISGKTSVCECELDSTVHTDILYKAVELALSRYAPNVKPQKSKED